ncbi:MAG: hypothetical protein AB7H80_06015 [Candidatus Kapaibacterium sp.]
MSTVNVSSLLIALSIISFSCLQLSAQEIIDLPFRSAPTIDGNFTSEEWADATSIAIEVAGSTGSVVFLKHDGANLYLAFTGTFGSSFLFPEINIDRENSKGTTWSESDWWFHISGTDCESKGKPNDYSDCAPDQEEWFGIPNFSQSQVPEVIEVLIPFTKLGVGSTLPDTLGMALDLTNTVNAWYYWPVGGKAENPSTWGTVILLPEKSSSVIDGVVKKSKEMNLTLQDLKN